MTFITVVSPESAVTLTKYNPEFNSERSKVTLSEIFVLDSKVLPSRFTKTMLCTFLKLLTVIAVLEGFG